MKPIVFIENHYATHMYYPLAVELKSRGHNVILIYWNAFFAKKWLNGFKCIKLKPGFENEINEKELILEDRAFKYFKRNYKEYALSDVYVENLLRNLNPKLILGEPTLFYELQIALAAKKLGYVYSYIGPSRFFRDRIVAYDGIELKYLKFISSDIELRSSNKSSDELSLNTLLLESNRSEKIVKIIQLKDYLLSLFYSGKNIRPSIFKKLLLEIKRKALLKRIPNYSIGNNIKKNQKTTILYPLQMQPESNSDVWGRPYSNQLENIKQLAKIENVEILVKLNPTTKYEFSQELLDFIKVSKTVNLVPVEKKMTEVLNYCDVVFSIVGTVILECLELKKPVIVLKTDAYLTELSGVNVVSSINKIDSNFLSNLKVATDSEWNLIIEEQRKYSVPGFIYDPLRSPNLVNNKSNNLMLTQFILDIANYKSGRDV